MSPVQAAIEHFKREYPDIYRGEKVTNLHFNKKNHTYWRSPAEKEGERLAGVTSVIGGFTPIADAGVSIGDNGAFISTKVLEGAGERGNIVHEAQEEHIKQYLGIGKKEDYEKALKAMEGDTKAEQSWEHFLNFEKDKKPEWLSTEMKMASSEGYAGTADAFAMIDGKLTLVDLKTGEIPIHVGEQTAAYVNAYRETTGYSGDIIRSTLGVSHKQDSYEFHTSETNKEMFKDTDMDSFRGKLHNYVEGGMKDPELTYDEGLSLLAEKMSADGEFSGFLSGPPGHINPEEEKALEFFQKGADAAGLKHHLNANRSGSTFTAVRDVPFEGYHGVGKSIGYGAGLGGIIGFGYAKVHNMMTKDEDDISATKSTLVGTSVGAIAGGALRKTPLITETVNTMDEMINSGFRHARGGAKVVREGFNAGKAGKTVTGALAAAAKAATKTF